MKKTETKQLSVFRDARGYLFEALRNDDSLFGGKFGQCLVSVNNPGVIKAWHKHKKQTDYTVCIHGKILFATATEKKKGKPEIKKLFLDGNKPVLVKVPAGTWHGYKVLGKKPATVLYIMDKTYNPKKPDEQRKTEGSFGKIWEAKK